MITGRRHICRRRIVTGREVVSPHELPAHVQGTTEVLADLARYVQHEDARVGNEAAGIGRGEHDQRLDIVVMVHVLAAVDAALAVPEHVDLVDAEVGLEIGDLLRELGAVVRDAAPWRDVGEFEANIARPQAIIPG